MAQSGTVRVRGADEVADTLHRLADDLDDMPAVDAEAAGTVQRSAQGFARRRTGAMRASIRVETAEHGATVTAGVGISRPYPAVQEYGSDRRGITANAYMRRAAETQERPVAQLYENAVDKMVKKVKGA